jgi:hypothetical protein
MEFPLRAEKWVPCSHCPTPLQYGSAFFRRYFESESMRCGACNRQLDGFDLKPDQTVSLTWTDVGVPKDAVVVSANITSQGIDVPAPSLLFGNTINNRPLSNPQFHVYGASWAKRGQSGPANFLITPPAHCEPRFFYTARPPPPVVLPAAPFAALGLGGALRRLRPAGLRCRLLNWRRGWLA